MLSNSSTSAQTMDGVIQQSGTIFWMQGSDGPDCELTWAFSKAAAHALALLRAVCAAALPLRAPRAHSQLTAGALDRAHVASGAV